MTRRLPFLALSLGLLTASQMPTPPTPQSTCEECMAYCNTIPMDPTECLELYCPRCVGAGTGVGVHPVVG